MRIAVGPAALAGWVAEQIDIPRGAPPSLPELRSCLVFNSLLVGALGNSEIMAKMPLPGFLFLTGFCEPLGTVLPQRFEQPIP